MVLLWLTRRPLPLCAVGKGGRQKAQDKAQALTTAPVTGRLLRHLPYTLASLLFSAFYNVADTLFVSHGVGDLAAAGISVVFPLTVLQGAIAQMVGAGAGALVSPCLGQKNYRAAGRITKSAMAFFYTTALGITCICLLFRTPLLRLFGATAEILPYARTYFTILAAGNVFSTGFSSIIRAEGRMDYSLWIWLLPTGVNLLLDWLLIYRLHLGIAGAALATGIGQLLSLCVYLFVYVRTELPIRLRRSCLRPDAALDGKLYAIGVPAILNLALPSLLVTFLNGLLAGFSQSYVVVLGIYYKLQTFLYLPANGIVQGMRPLIGYNYGAKQHARVKKLYELTLIMSAAIMAAGTVICLFASRPLMQLFTSNPETITIGQTALRIICLGFVVSAVSTTSSGALEGLGKGTESLVISLCRYLLFIMPLAAVLCHFLGANGVWHAFWITEALSALVAYPVYRRAVGKR